jgi:hypothetical protein
MYWWPVNMSWKPMTMSVYTPTKFSEPLCMSMETFSMMLWTFTISKRAY